MRVWLALGYIAGAAASATAAPRDALLALLRNNLPAGRSSGSAVLARDVDRACADLEASAHEAPVFPRDLGALDGAWTLAYTTTATGTPPGFLGAGILGRIPSPASFVESTALSPRVLDQAINTQARTLTSRVAVRALPPGPFGGLGSLPGPFGAVAGSELLLDLDYDFTLGSETIGRVDEDYGPALFDSDGAEPGGALVWSGGIGARDAGARLNLKLRRVRRAGTGAEIAIPQVLGARRLLLVSPGGNFVTTYLDDSLRVSRAVFPGRELRVFTRAGTPRRAATVDATAAEDVEREFTEEDFREEIFDEATGSFRPVD